MLLLLSGCAGLIAAGSTAGAIGGGLAVANQVASTVDTTIQAACVEYEKGTRRRGRARDPPGWCRQGAASKVTVI